jgi:hypothetical protein
MDATVRVGFLGLAGSWDEAPVGFIFLYIYLVVIGALFAAAGVMSLYRRKYTLALVLSGAGMLFSSFSTLPSFILLILSKDTYQEPKTNQI